MEIKQNADLTKLNTLAVSALARYFAEINSEQELTELFKLPEFRNNKKFILGGGSNILFTKDFDGIVVKISLKGRKIVSEDSESVVLEVSAGEDWHELVTYAVAQNWGGIENLAYIPGTVGAAPVQNIAAYGENFSDVFESLNAFNIETGETRIFTKRECNFHYRESIFKKELKGKYIILSVRFKLLKNPELQTLYYQTGITRDSIKEELQKRGVGPYTVRDVYESVISIRKRKLPDPMLIPTTGSFFLNSVVPVAKYEELKNRFSELQAYPIDQMSAFKENDTSILQEQFVKIATGRILQELGWLGKWIGNVGMHDKHALVLVTNGKATGEEVLNFAQLIQEDYLKNIGIKLETEVNLIT
jgi:UDP-N-acetylmuramate dehydrogenase